MPPTLLITRPRAQSERFAALCREALPGMPIIISPIVEIEPIGAKIPQADGVILTSENAVACLPPGYSVPIAWCVGRRTAEAAQALGLTTEVADGDGASLLSLIRRHRPGGRLVHVRGEHRAVDIAGALRQAGFDATEVVAYRQQGRPLGADAQRVLQAPDPVLLPLFSERSARLLAAEGPFAAPLHIIAISAKVARAWSETPPQTLDIAASPDGESIIQSLTTLVARVRGLRGTDRASKV